MSDAFDEVDSIADFIEFKLTGRSFGSVFTSQKRKNCKNNSPKTQYYNRYQ